MFKDDLKNKTDKSAGKIVIRADTVGDSNHEVDAKLNCTLFPKGGLKVPCLRKQPDNPFLMIERENED